MNHVLLTGNLTADPVVRVLNIKGKQVSVVTFTVAENRRFKQANGEWGESTNFVPCESWDSGAEQIAKNFFKGNKILIEGNLRTESWDDKDTGTKRSKMLVRVDRFEKFGKFEKAEHKNETVPASHDKDDESAGAPGEDIPF